MHATARRLPSAIFVLGALSIAGACTLLVRSRIFAVNPDVAAWGVTFDLAITLPFLYWLTMVRTGRARALTIAPVFIAGTVIAAALVPRGQQHFLEQLKMFAGGAAELALIGAFVLRLRAMRRTPIESNDPHAKIAGVARALAGEGRVAEVIASEVSMMYYALFCWRKKPEKSSARTFTLHERAGWSTILVCIIVMIVAESIGMHILLGLWSAKAAWIWTALDLWAIAWLLGDYHAMRLRRSSFDGDALSLRFGLRWNVTVPLETIESIESISSESQWKRRDVLKAAILEEPRWLIRFTHPLVASGLAGIRKEITAIALLADDDDAVPELQALVARRA